MKQLLLILIFFAPIFAFAQKVNKKAEAQAINEGYKLYLSEMASWHGTDLFLTNHGDLKDKAAGYFSYAHQDSVTCIFYSKDNVPTSLVSFTFDKSFNLNNVKTKATSRAFTEQENILYQIRKRALHEVNTDTLFKHFNNTSLNLVPLVEGNSKKVYVLTGPQVNGVVLLGNDYLMTFNKKNEVVAKKKLHNNLIPVDHAADKAAEAVTVHSHLPATGDYITSTDVCTLLLYGKMSNWKQHYIISENFVTIWDIDSRNSVMLTKKAWEKIAAHSKAAAKD